MSDQTIHTLVVAFRKCCHMSEYALMALLFYCALNRGSNGPETRLRRAGLAFVLAVAYACTDEWHQSFVPSREASVVDVMIDALGAALGLAAWIAIRRGNTQQIKAAQP